MARILGETDRVHATGAMVLLGRTAQTIGISMARSYVFALLIITPLMMGLLGGIRRGLIAMIPNLMPILLTLGLMPVLDIPLDASTLLIGGIILGLAVDDTIHFMHKFRRYYEYTANVEKAVRLTLETTGSALLFTSLVLAAGFFIFKLGYMVNVGSFGLLAGFATGVAFLADLLLGPALMAWFLGRNDSSLEFD